MAGDLFPDQLQPREILIACSSVHVSTTGFRLVFKTSLSRTSDILRVRENYCMDVHQFIDKANIGFGKHHFHLRCCLSNQKKQNRLLLRKTAGGMFFKVEKIEMNCHELYSYCKLEG
ncbi:hypothetical protein AB3S75_032279 [Citrus x aurantiifolia]